MKKTFKVVMLPTDKSNKEGDIVLNDTEFVLPHQVRLAQLNCLTYNSKQPCINQHLYLVSDETPKHGELCYSIRGFVGFFGRFENSYENECKKVIGSTDKTLTPYEWIPESFVKAYIKAFNEDKPITTVSIDFFDSEGLEDNEGYVDIIGFGKVHINNFPLPKRREDMSLIINKEKSYTEEDLKKAFDAGYDLGQYEASKIDWEDSKQYPDEIEFKSFEEYKEQI